MTMRGLMRCVSTGSCRVAPGARAAVPAAASGAGAGKVPAGHVPVEVGAEGEETERFVVPAELLARPPIAELLRRAAQEYGYARRGPLRIPCPAAAFRRLLGALTAAGAGDGGLTLAYFSVVV
ncbi:auxin-responsive protein SAUR71-like [Oryza brachyantha]|uniref:auxin-responsive protein SAUR71-like n=1 Tax=Oryza brachyantha TaxID=4533 RepID=UPI001ADB7B13|nr:auxin-responsive protein SAUR71-like [Oryza brachyantha]